MHVRRERECTLGGRMEIGCDLDVCCCQVDVISVKLPVGVKSVGVD